LDTHVPDGPGFEQYVPAVSWQSLSDAHAVLHAVRLAQTKPPGQPLGVPATHPPVPLQADAVSWPLPHAVPHDVPLPGNTHAPTASQSLAPQVPAVGLHAAVQQRVPVPLTPQTELVHWSVAPHVAPGAPFGTHVPDAPGFRQ
jgi:hypothetical protein